MIARLDAGKHRPLNEGRSISTPATSETAACARLLMSAQRRPGQEPGDTSH